MAVTLTKKIEFLPIYAKVVNILPKNLFSARPFPSLSEKNFYRTQVYLGSDLWVRVSQTHSKTFGANFTDVTLADEDTNSILTDKVYRNTLQGIAHAP